MLRRFVIVASTAAALSTGLIVSLGSPGCTHDREPPPPVVDAPKVDVELDSQSAVPPVTVLVDGVDVPADLECLGKERPDSGVIFPADAGDEAGADAPAGDAGSVPVGTLVEKQLELIGFGTGGSDKLGNQKIDVYYGNTVTATPDQSVTTDEKGLFKVKLPEGLRVAYHVKASPQLDDYFGFDDMHNTVLPGATLVRWQGVTVERSEFFRLALTGDKTWRPKPGHGLMAGRVFDCKRRNVQYAEVIIKDYTDDPAGVTLPFVKCGEGLCRVFLTDSELPDVGRPYTSRSSLFTILDLPVGRKLRAVALGTTVDGKKYEVAWRNLELKDGLLTTQFLEPTNKIGF